MLKRTFDVLLSAGLLLILSFPLLLIAAAIRISSEGPAIYWSERIGKGNILFRMPKFRTMSVNTPAVATHLMINPDMYTTPIGRYLRRTSLDELPQLWSILVGDMSFVGPRPALFNQDDLVGLRTNAGVEKITPGLTGWAQINGRDELVVAEKVRLDKEYMQRMSFWFDMKIMFLTVFRVLRHRGISH